MHPGDENVARRRQRSTRCLSVAVLLTLLPFVVEDHFYPSFPEATRNLMWGIGACFFVYSCWLSLTPPNLDSGRARNPGDERIVRRLKRGYWCIATGTAAMVCSMLLRDSFDDLPDAAHYVMLIVAMCIGFYGVALWCWCFAQPPADSYARRQARKAEASREVEG